LLSNIVASRVRSSGVSVESAAAMAFRSGVLVVFEELVQAVVQSAGLLGPTWIKPSLFCIHATLIDRSIGTLAGDDSDRVSQALALLIAGEFLPGR
jgi:hypothetical protein